MRFRLLGGIDPLREDTAADLKGVLAPDEARRFTGSTLPAAPDQAPDFLASLNPGGACARAHDLVGAVR